MRIISRKMISDYWEGEPQSEDALKSWYAEAKSATWLSPVDVKEKYGKASILKDGRVVLSKGIRYVSGISLLIFPIITC